MDRKAISFEQAEGRLPMPTQLALKEISSELRAQLFFVLDSFVVESNHNYDVAEPWKEILLQEFVFHQHKFVDEYTPNRDVRIKYIRDLIKSGDYVDVFGFIQWVLRHKRTPSDFVKYIEMVLVSCRAAYRVVDGDTIAPVATSAEVDALESGLSSARSAGITGAYSHLRSAIEAATAGKYSDCIREAIHGVEAVAVTLAPGSTELGPALSKLEANGAIHGAMKTAFRSLYGYASDEKGIRHSLLDQDAAKVDEADALFMLGACASFVSYLIAKGRAAGLLSD